MANDYMEQMVRGEKNYEFRKYRIASTVRRIWFYLNRSLTSLTYARLTPQPRNQGEPKLVEDGLGNKEFNEHHADWDKFDYSHLSLFGLAKFVSTCHWAHTGSTASTKSRVRLAKRPQVWVQDGAAGFGIPTSASQRGCHMESAEKDSAARDTGC
jgi:hypothetical protein